MKVPHTEIRRLCGKLVKDELYAIDCYTPCDEQILMEPKHLGIEGFSRRKNLRMALYLWVSESEEATHIKEIGRSEALGLARALASWFEIAPEEIVERP